MTQPKATVKKVKQKKLTVTVNFTDTPDLYQSLVESAKLNFRSLEKQILYCVWKQTHPEQDDCI